MCARIARLASALVGCAVLSPRPLQAQDTTAVEYAAKIICGAPNRPALAPGTYYTAINVHNPGRDTVRFQQKFATTLAREAPGPISPFSSAVLLPDQALEIDCADIARLARLQGFIKGFAVLQSPSELDVVGVYTAAQSRTAGVVALDVERVPGRRLGGGGCLLPDLVVDSISRPIATPGGGSRIDAVIRNLGPGAAAASLARLIDPSTLQSSGAPQNATVPTPPLAAGATTTVTFNLSYWIFNPDAEFEITADYKGEVSECNEANNTRRFFQRG